MQMIYRLKVLDSHFGEKAKREWDSWKINSPPKLSLKSEIQMRASDRPQAVRKIRSIRFSKTIMKLRIRTHASVKTVSYTWLAARRRDGSTKSLRSSTEYLGIRWRFSTCRACRLTSTRTTVLSLPPKVPKGPSTLARCTRFRKSCVEKALR